MPILPDGQTPDWANHLGADGMPLFIEHIERYFSERGLVIALDLGRGVVTPQRQGQARSALFGLRNLAQKHGFEIASLIAATLRYDAGKAVEGVAALFVKIQV